MVVYLYLNVNLFVCLSVASSICVIYLTFKLIQFKKINREIEVRITISILIESSEIGLFNFNVK